MSWIIRCSTPGCTWQSEADDSAVAEVWKAFHQSTAPEHAVTITTGRPE